MAEYLVKWPSGREPISKIEPSDGRGRMEFPWRWTSGAISTNLDVIWEMSVKDDFQDLSDTMGELRNFYTSQKPTWEKLRNAHATFDLNRQELVKDAEAAANRRVQCMGKCECGNMKGRQYDSLQLPPINVTMPFITC
jgi:hypothetical protein